MAKQQTQFHFMKPEKLIFGGSLQKSHPKKKRPLDSKLPIHLVLRSRNGVLRLPKNLRKVNSAVYDTAKKHGITLYKYANVGNHLHLVIKIPGRRRWSAFIRELTGKIAQAVGGKKFWLFRPFTRVVPSWRKAFPDIVEYVHLNILEAEGFISRKDFKRPKDLRRFYQECWG